MNGLRCHGRIDGKGREKEKEPAAMNESPRYRHERLVGGLAVGLKTPIGITIGLTDYFGIHCGKKVCEQNSVQPADAPHPIVARSA